MHAHGAIEPGTVLAERYRVGEVVGSGGMASVYRAVDEVLGREVAVKVLAGGSADPAAAHRERAELQLLATLDHRALVTLFDAVESHVDDRPVTCLVMELVDGPSLASRLDAAREQGAPLAGEDVRAMAHDLAEALAVVHDRGVVHRDVKPANILLAPSPAPGREFGAKLADFGIAALVDGTRVTATGTVLGSAGYLSPEQTTGERVGPASDVYSLGLVLLEALTGEQEYGGPLMEAVSARLVRDPVVPVSLGAPWTTLLAAMTARDPETRPTAAEVAEGIAGATGPLPAAPVPTANAADDATAPISAAELAAAGAAAGVTAAALPHADEATGPARGAPAPEPQPATAPLPALGGAEAGRAAASAEAAPARRRRPVGLVVAAAVVAAAAVGAVAVAVTTHRGDAPATDAEQSQQAPASTGTPPADETEAATEAPAGVGAVVTTPEASEAPSESAAPTETAPERTAPAETAPDEAVVPAEPEQTAPVEPAPTEPPATEPAPEQPAPEPAPTADTGTGGEPATP